MTIIMINIVDINHKNVILKLEVVCYAYTIFSRKLHVLSRKGYLKHDAFL